MTDEYFLDHKVKLKDDMIQMSDQIWYFIWIKSDEKRLSDEQFLHTLSATCARMLVMMSRKYPNQQHKQEIKDYFIEHFDISYSSLLTKDRLK